MHYHTQKQRKLLPQIKGGLQQLFLQVEVMLTSFMQNYIVGNKLNDARDENEKFSQKANIYLICN